MNAWLARVEMNLRNPVVRGDLSNAKALHQRIMMLVPDGLGENARQQAGVLFRIDQEELAVTALVQARIPLDAGRLPDGYGHTLIRDLSPMFTALAKGQGVKYRIAANASKRQREHDQAAPGRGPIIPLRGAAAEDWWRRRAEDVGLSPLTVISSAVGAAQGSGIRHDFTRFDGVAIVTDPALLATAVLEGIGRGKPYGGGLLSLAPTRLS